MVGVLTAKLLYSVRIIALSTIVCRPEYYRRDANHAIHGQCENLHYYEVRSTVKSIEYPRSSGPLQCGFFCSIDDKGLPLLLRQLYTIPDFIRPELTRASSMVLIASTPSTLQYEAPVL